MDEAERSVTIFIDNDSWILSYAEKLACRLDEDGYQCSIARHRDELSGGWLNFILGCTQILPGAILSRYEHNLVVHESDLPEGRGFAPMSWQILEGKSVIPVCLFEASDAPDAGKIWLRDEIVLAGDELNIEWRHLQGEKTIELCLRFIKEFSDLVPWEQTGEKSHYRKRLPEDSRLNVDETIAQQFNLLRIVNNNAYPAFFEMKGHRYLLKIEKLDD